VTPCWRRQAASAVRVAVEVFPPVAEAVELELAVFALLPHAASSAAIASAPSARRKRFILVLSEVPVSRRFRSRIAS
jgi:hypothetical protein